MMRLVLSAKTSTDLGARALRGTEPEPSERRAAERHVAALVRQVID